MAKTLGDITRELQQQILEPAEEQAAGIIGAAKEEAASIVQAARTEAEKICAEARREAEQTLSQLQSDLDTGARNFILMVEERLESAVVRPVVAKEVRAALNDPGFLQRMLEILLPAYFRDLSEARTLTVLLPKKHQEELEAWFVGKFVEKTSEPIEVEFTDKMTFGFTLGIKGEGTCFNFSSGMVEAFSGFCSPRFRKHFLAPEAASKQ